MEENKNKLLVILGPTASGKSDLAIKIAKISNGEIISADSRQIYKGMDIGTGKVIKDSKFQKKYFSQKIEHHLLDIADPKKYYSVVQYQKKAIKIIEKIWKKNKLPILCGGTGLYISSLIEGWQFPNIKPNQRLRKNLEKKEINKLFNQLKKIDPERASNIDSKNKRRIIRALEIVLQKNKVGLLEKKLPNWDVLIIGITKNKEDLQKLIKRRLLKRIREGMIDEIIKLKKKKVSSQKLESFGLEYRWINRYLEKKYSLKEMTNFLFKDICKYAKRQMTWFKKMPLINWVNNHNQAKIIIRKWLKI